MRFLIFTFFLILGCTSFNTEKTEKVYICGNRECKNKKEISEYFKKNISIEVYTISKSKKKDRDYDLVELNMTNDEKKEIISLANEKKQIEENLKKRKQIAKIDLQKGEVVKKIKPIKKTMVRPKITLVKICKNSIECDISDVAKKILDRANKNKYPDLTLK